MLASFYNTKFCFYVNRFTYNRINNNAYTYSYENMSRYILPTSWQASIIPKSTYLIKADNLYEDILSCKMTDVCNLQTPRLAKSNQPFTWAGLRFVRLFCFHNKQINSSPNDRMLVRLLGFFGFQNTFIKIFKLFSIWTPTKRS